MPSMREENARKRYEAAFARLKKSKFRSRFRLSEADRKYVADKGMAVIRSHCEDFVRTRLAPSNPPNDGKQTPMCGHPVFVAQHACACCCRDCLAKWWKVPRGVEIPAERQQDIVDFLMAWIEKEMEKMPYASVLRFVPECARKADVLVSGSPMYFSNMTGACRTENARALGKRLVERARTYI